jgi:hypothetical protein
MNSSEVFWRNLQSDLSRGVISRENLKRYRNEVRESLARYRNVYNQLDWQIDGKDYCLDETDIEISRLGMEFRTALRKILNGKQTDIVENLTLTTQDFAQTFLEHIKPCFENEKGLLVFMVRIEMLLTLIPGLAIAIKKIRESETKIKTITLTVSLGEAEVMVGIQADQGLIYLEARNPFLKKIPSDQISQKIIEALYFKLLNLQKNSGNTSEFLELLKKHLPIMLEDKTQKLEGELAAQHEAMAVPIKITLDDLIDPERVADEADNTAKATPDPFNGKDFIEAPTLDESFDEPMSGAFGAPSPDVANIDQGDVSELAQAPGDEHPAIAAAGVVAAISDPEVDLGALGAALVDDGETETSDDNGFTEIAMDQDPFDSVEPPPVVKTDDTGDYIEVVGANIADPESDDYEVSPADEGGSPASINSPSDSLHVTVYTPIPTTPASSADAVADAPTATDAAVSNEAEQVDPSDTAVLYPPAADIDSEAGSDEDLSAIDDGIPESNDEAVADLSAVDSATYGESDEDAEEAELVSNKVSVDLRCHYGVDKLITAKISTADKESDVNNHPQWLVNKIRVFTEFVGNENNGVLENNLDQLIRSIVRNHSDVNARIQARKYQPLRHKLLLLARICGAEPERDKTGAISNKNLLKALKSIKKTALPKLRLVSDKPVSPTKMENAGYSLCEKLIVRGDTDEEIQEADAQEEAALKEISKGKDGRNRKQSLLTNFRNASEKLWGALRDGSSSTGVNMSDQEFFTFMRIVIDDEKLLATLRIAKNIGPQDNEGTTLHTWLSLIQAKIEELRADGTLGVLTERAKIAIERRREQRRKNSRILADDEVERRGDDRRKT